ncbi:MAG: phosphatase PAP2 family protein [Oscillospiraceae bacterium]|nr:phosphatase PAP2 family protein [Oscillospiraceae bacterium]
MKRKLWCITGALWMAFILFTVLLTCVDVQPIGPQESAVGLAGLNAWVFARVGVHWFWYHLTDWLGFVPIAWAFGFAAVGVYQWIRRRGIRKVDGSILVLGGFYLLVIGCYLFFEQVVINFRPVLTGSVLEASYPSSHTVMTLCLMSTAAMEFRTLCPERKGLCRCVDMLAVLVSLITVVGRLVSGVHWFTDIIGGILLSAALVVMYWAIDWRKKG